MIHVSQVLKMHTELTSFSDLLPIVQALGEQGQILISMDEKPPYADTPEDWELALENAFTWGGRGGGLS